MCQLNGTAWQRTLPGFPVNLEEALVTLWLFDMYIYIYSCSTAMEARLWPIYIDDKNDDLPTVKKMVIFHSHVKLPVGSRGHLEFVLK